MSARDADAAAPLDTLRVIETPEGVELELRLAGPVVRALAWTLDAAIRYGALLLCLLVLSGLGGTGWGILLILAFLSEWFYPVLFEVYGGGATPGKKTLGLRVVNDDGSPVGFAASLIRNLLRAADFMPLLYGGGLICMLINRESKRLGDLAAATVVIHARAAALPPAAVGDGERRPLGVALTPAEQKLLLNFAERSGQLNPDRRAELAALLPRLDAAAPRGAAAPDDLLAHARWLGSASS